MGNIGYHEQQLLQPFVSVTARFNPRDPSVHITIRNLGA